MSGGTEHPSYFALDSLHARGGLAASDVGAELRSHVEGCAECTGYLGTLAQTAAESPAWIAAVAAAPRVPRATPPRRAWRRMGLSAAAALGVAALLALYLRPTVPATGDGGEAGADVRVKGEPAIALYLLRDQHVRRWDGHEAVHVGDRLRLEIAGAGYTHVAVATPGIAGSVEVLYAGDLGGAAPLLLPPSWEVDRAPGPEVLHVVLARDAISDGNGVAAVVRAGGGPGLWVRTLRLDKSDPAGP